jgi:hypothetical protein
VLGAEKIDFGIPVLDHAELGVETAQLWTFGTFLFRHKTLVYG